MDTLEQCNECRETHFQVVRRKKSIELVCDYCNTTKIYYTNSGWD